MRSRQVRRKKLRNEKVRGNDLRGKELRGEEVRCKDRETGVPSAKVKKPSRCVAANMETLKTTNHVTRTRVRIKLGLRPLASDYTESRCDCRCIVPFLASLLYLTRSDTFWSSSDQVIKTQGSVLAGVGPEYQRGAVPCKSRSVSVLYTERALLARVFRSTVTAKRTYCEEPKVSRYGIPDIRCRTFRTQIVRTPIMLCTLMYELNNPKPVHSTKSGQESSPQQYEARLRSAKRGFSTTA